MGTDTIRFDIPGAGPHTISVTSELPAIYDPLIISGTTQPGASCESGDLRIVLDGTDAGAGADGLTFETDNSAVRGLAIKDFPGDGIVLSLGTALSASGLAAPADGSGVTVQCNMIGTEHGDVFSVQLQAQDGLVQQGAWSDRRSFIVDMVPPTVTMDLTATAVVSGSLIRGGAFTLYGDVLDDGGVEAVDVCVDGACGWANLHPAAGPKAVTYDHVASLPIAIGGEISHTFDVAEDFVLGQVMLGFSAQHPRRDDLQVELASPDGTVVTVLDDDGISGTQYANYDVLLDDAAPQGLADAAGDDDPGNRFYERLVRPYQPLRAFQGEGSGGLWTLRIRDLDPTAHDGSYVGSRLILIPRDIHAKSGRWIYRTPGIGGGDHVRQTVAIYGEDVVGNQTQDPATLVVWVDDVPPQIAVDTVVTEIAGGTTETVLGGSVTDGGPATYVSAHVRTPAGDAYRQRAGRNGDRWWIDLEGRYPGRYTLWVTASDRAGNSAVEGPFTVDVPTQAGPPGPLPGPNVPVGGAVVPAVPFGLLLPWVLLAALVAVLLLSAAIFARQRLP
jgi:hypothetical protein